MKVVGKQKVLTPVERLRAGQLLRERVGRYNPYPRLHGIFKFRTWEDLEKWRQSQTNPRLR